MKIHAYASQGDRTGVRNELGKGVPVDARDEQNSAPLAHAASKPAADEFMLSLLIESGADVNAAVDESKSYPIGLAACSGSLGKVQLLLDAGANIRFESPKGYTVLINIMYSLHDDERLVPMIELLVTCGAETDCETEYGESPLSVASHFGRFDAVKSLLDAGADPALLQWTELMKAVALGTCGDVQRLLAIRCPLLSLNTGWHAGSPELGRQSSSSRMALRSVTSCFRLVATSTAHLTRRYMCGSSSSSRNTAAEGSDGGRSRL